MPTNLPFVLVIGLKVKERPYIHGYNNESDRDKAYNQFKETGEITLHDSVLGVTETFRPAYVARFNMIDGTLNKERIEEEIDGLK